LRPLTPAESFNIGKAFGAIGKGANQVLGNPTVRLRLGARRPVRRRVGRGSSHPPERVRPLGVMVAVPWRTGRRHRRVTRVRMDQP
jgi:hypothetical protein